jgi:cytosine/adenosine deaminase-related metal-dependent hydrolase
MLPHDDLYAAVVYQANPDDVKTVFINGKLVMLDRKFVSFDLKKAEKDFNELFSRIEPVARQLSDAALKKQPEN